MAVNSVGERPQAPAPTQVQKASDPALTQKSGGGAAVASATGAATAQATAQAQVTAKAEVGAQAQVTAQLQAERAADAFVATKVEPTALTFTPAAAEPAFGFTDPAAADPTQAGAAAAAAKVPDPATPAEAIQNVNEALHDLHCLPPDAPLGQVFDTFVGALDSMLDLMNMVLEPPVAQNPEPSITNPNPLGIPGPGGPGTQPGAYGVVAIDQNDPNLDGKQGIYAFGQTNCAPTSMAQIARGRAIEDPNYSLTWNEGGQTVTKKVADMTNEELVSVLGTIGKTDGAGTSPLGVIDMANAMGLSVDESEVMYDPNWREGQPSNSFNEKWLTDQLANGKKVVVNGAYEANGQDGKTELVGHYMTVAGRNADGTFAVVDPWDGKVKNYTAAELAKFMQANPANGGVMLAIG